MKTPLVAILTDFAEEDFFVASLKAVIAGINPEVRTVDISHRVPSFDIEAGSFILSACYGFFPEGAIFLAVVDPGVATGRKILLVRTTRHFFIAPDNGLLSGVLAREKTVDIREVSSDRFFLSRGPSTFEARERMAPAAAWLSQGIDPKEFGPRLVGCRRLDLPGPKRTRRGILGKVVYVDKFGNLITDIPGRELSRITAVRVGGQDVRDFRASYGIGKKGVPFGIVNSLGLLEIAVKEGSAASEINVGRGTPVELLVR